MNKTLKSKVSYSTEEDSPKIISLSTFLEIGSYNSFSDISKFHSIIGDKITREASEHVGTKIRGVLLFKILQLLIRDNRLSESDTKIVNDKMFQQILFVRFERNFKDALTKYQEMLNTRDELKEKIITAIDGHDEKELQKYCREIEQKYGKMWLIDVMSEYPQYLSDDFDKYSSFTVLTYIGNELLFIKHFDDTIANYIESYYYRGMSYIPVLIDYIEIVSEYIPYVKDAKIVYDKLKKVDITTIDQKVDENNDYLSNILEIFSSSYYKEEEEEEEEEKEEEEEEEQGEKEREEEDEKLLNESIIEDLSVDYGIPEEKLKNYYETHGRDIEQLISDLQEGHFN